MVMPASLVVQEKTVWTHQICKMPDFKDASIVLRDRKVNTAHREDLVFGECVVLEAYQECLDEMDFPVHQATWEIQVIRCSY